MAIREKVIVVALISVIFGLVVFYETNNIVQDEVGLNIVQDEVGLNIVQECGRDNICVHDRLEELSETESEDLVLSTINNIITEWDEEDEPCHANAHHMGMFLVGYLDGDLVKSLSIVKNMCGNAMYHGILENYIPIKVMVDKISLESLDIIAPCKNFDSSQSSNAYRQCVHGMGHGLIKAYDYDVFEAVKRCDEFLDYRGNIECLDGLFMENHNQYFGNAEVGAYDEDDLLYPCNELDEKYQSHCYQYQGNIILNENDFSYLETFEICDGLPSIDSQKACTRTVSQYMTDWFFEEDFDKVVEMCNVENTNQVQSCIGSAVYSIVIYGDANALEELCPLFQEEDMKTCEYYYDYVMRDNDLI